MPGAHRAKVGRTGSTVTEAARHTRLPNLNAGSMKSRALIFAAFAALAAIGIVSGHYMAVFGLIRSPTPEVWGQFGDYFGGVLNPIFALAAFLAALWSIGMQQREARAAAQQLAEQTEIARKEFEAFAAGRLEQELLHVIREIDQRLAKLLQTVVSAPGADPIIRIFDMVAEADRLAQVKDWSKSYETFCFYANQPGSIVEARVREIKYLVNKLREFVEHYNAHRARDFAPVLLYYADKAYQLRNMLNGVGMPAETWKTFKAVIDRSNTPRNPMKPQIGE